MYQLFKPNARNAGFAFTFNIGSCHYKPKTAIQKSEKALWVNAIAQSGWNEKTKTGSFKGNANKPNKNIKTKMTVNEVGGLLKTIRTGTPFSAYHSYNGNNTQISFSKHFKKIKNKQTGQWEKSDEVVGFFFTITKNVGEQSSTFGIPFSFAEAETFSVFLKRLLNIHFDGTIKAHAQQFKNNQYEEQDEEQYESQDEYEPENIQQKKQKQIVEEVVEEEEIYEESSEDDSENYSEEENPF